jgi:PAS domain S-box-containing protein
MGDGTADLLEQTVWPRRTRSRAAILALGAYLLLYLSWQLLHWTPGKQQLGQAFLPVMDAVALYATWGASRRTAASPELRAFWRLMALAVASQTVADLLLLVNVVRYEVAPFPTAADPFFLAFYVLLFLALLRVPVAHVSPARRLRIALDGATIVVGGGAVVWYFVLGPTAEAGGQSALATAVSLAYPIGDLILLVGLAAVLLRQAPEVLRLPLLLIAAGVLMSIVADVVYGYGVLHGTYRNGDPIDTLYVLEFAAFALAGASQRTVRPGDLDVSAGESSRRDSRASWLPYLSVAIGFGLLLGVEAGNRFFPNVSLVVIVIVLAALVATRQYVAQREVVGAEAALRESERRLQAIFDNAGVGITFTDVEGPAIVDVNQTFTEMVGYSARELRGGDYSTITHPDDQGVLEGLGPDTIDGFHHELRIVRADGSMLWGHLTLALMRDEAGIPRHVIGVLEDITQRREAERVKDEFLSVVGHELRTPLTSIRGSLGLLEGGVLGELPAEAANMVALAVANTDRLVRLINDLLDIERMDAGRIEFELAPVAAADLVSQAVQAVQASATEAGVTLRTDVADLTVSADADRIVQALVNLLGNAVKFSTDGGAVTVTAGREDGQALFSIADTGRGIPADQLETIFERFRQVDSSDAREKGGTGLGLPISREIVEHHGGRMWAESPDGHGSTFRFTLSMAHDTALPGLAGEREEATP